MNKFAAAIAIAAAFSTVAPLTTAFAGSSPSTAAVASATAGAAAPVPGDAMPSTNLDGWRQIFTDDFNTDVPVGRFPTDVSTKWGAYKDGWGDSTRHGTYMPSKVVSVADGILTKNIHTEGSTHMVAAIAPKVPGDGLYGRYAVRWRADKLPGYKMAWLLWPNGHPGGTPNRIGELDWPEKNLDSPETGGFVHRKNGTSANQGWVRIPSDQNEWNTDVIEWSPGLVVFLHNGLEVYRTTDGVPEEAMHWVLQTETAMGGAPAPANSVAGNVQVKWVAAWAYDPSAVGPLPARFSKVVAPAVAVGAVALGVESSPGTRQAKWMINGVEIGSSQTAPFSTSWDSSALPNGIYPIATKVRDSVGWTTSETKSITVKNANLAFNPPARVSGRAPLTVTASRWVQQVQYVVDGKLIGTRTQAPWSIVWDTTKWSNGTHVIYAKARDDVRWRDLPSQTIIVSN